MSSQTHIPERMGWLRDATQEFFSKTTKCTRECKTRRSALAKLQERYLGVENLVECYMVWKEEKLAHTKPLELDARKYSEASKSLCTCTMLLHGLQLRQEALAVETGHIVERRLQVGCNKAEKLHVCHRHRFFPRT